MKNSSDSESLEGGFLNLNNLEEFFSNPGSYLGFFLMPNFGRHWQYLVVVPPVNLLTRQLA